MSTNPLRKRMAELDPCPPEMSVDPPTSDHARQLVEHIMKTDIEIPSVDDAGVAPVLDLGARRRTAPRLLAAAAAVVVVFGGIAVVANQSSDDSPALPALALSLPGGDVISSCIVFDIATLAAQPVAFGGTVTAMTDTSVSIEVDRWYVGGDASTVEISVPAGTSAALDGVDFVVGERFLITSFDAASVNFCGLSGPATPELEALFAEAFPG